MKNVVEKSCRQSFANCLTFLTNLCDIFSLARFLEHACQAEISHFADQVLVHQNVTGSQILDTKNAKQKLEITLCLHKTKISTVCYQSLEISMPHGILARQPSESDLFQQNMYFLPCAQNACAPSTSSPTRSLWPCRATGSPPNGSCFPVKQKCIRFLLLNYFISTR